MIFYMQVKSLIKESEMKAQDLKKSFHKRSPKFLPESFLIDKNKVRKILDSVRSEVSGKQKGERTKEKESSEDFIDRKSVV